MASKFKYDIFISYSHKNSDWVTGILVPKLENHGFKVFIDVRDFRGGSFSVIEMERAVNSSKRVILVLTNEYLKSQWTMFENVMGQTLDPAASNRKIIPILRNKCKIPLRLQILHYRDLSHDDPKQWDLLIQDLM